MSRRQVVDLAVAAWLVLVLCCTHGQLVAALANAGRALGG